MFEGGVTLDRAAALADLSGDEALGAADHLSRAHILAAGDPLEFSHPLLRAAVYGGLTRQRTAALHRRAAAAPARRAARRASRWRRTCC